MEKQRNINSNKDGRFLISYLLNDEETFKMLMPLLKKDFFKTARHKTIMEALLKMHQSSPYVNRSILKYHLKKNGLLEKVGGEKYIDGLTEPKPTIANIRLYDGLFCHEYDLVGLIKKCITAERKTKNHKSGPVLTSGFSAIDKKIDKLDRYGLIIIAARPDMGKSVLAYKIALHNAVNNRIPTAVFSFSMRTESLVQFLAYDLSRVYCPAIRLGELLKEELEKLIQACALLFNSPLFIKSFAMETPDGFLSISNIKREAQKLKIDFGIRLLFIDNLQSVKPLDKESKIRSLSKIARELDITIILLSGLAQNIENKTDKRPRLNDLIEAREYGDLVLFLYRDTYYFLNGGCGVEIIIAKNKNGCVSSVKMPCATNFLAYYADDCCFDE
jgi:replicative DNA helicase